MNSRIRITILVSWEQLRSNFWKLTDLSITLIAISLKKERLATNHEWKLINISSDWENMRKRL